MHGPKPQLPREITVMLIVVVAMLPLASFKFTTAIGWILDQQSGERVCDGWCVALLVVMTTLAFPLGYMYGRLARWLLSVAGSRWGMAAAIPTAWWWLTSPWPALTRALNEAGLGLLRRFSSLMMGPIGGVYTYWFPYFSGFVVGCQRAHRDADARGGSVTWAVALFHAALPVVGVLASAFLYQRGQALTQRIAAAAAGLVIGGLMGILSDRRWLQQQTWLQAAPALFLAGWLIFSPSHLPLIPPQLLNSRNCSITSFWGPALVGYVLAMSYVSARRSSPASSSASRRRARSS